MTRIVNAEELVGTIRTWQETFSRQAPAQPEKGSDMAGDAEVNPRFHGAHYAWAGVVGAVDHLHAVQTLIYDAGALHTYAPHALIRAAMENSAAAVWLLAPDDRRTRLVRALRLAYEDRKQDEAAWKELQLTQPRTPSAAELKQQVLDQAAALHIARKDVTSRFGYLEVVKEAAKQLRLPDRLITYTWRLCSGHAHGRQWASLTALRREVTDSASPDVANVKFTAELDNVMLLVGVAVKLNQAAIDLYDRRRAAPAAAA